MSNVVSAASTRRSDTPNAVMTTLASPTLGSTRQLALWRVRMEGGQSGPLHVFDSEQVWTVLDGRMRVTVDGKAVDLEPGDTVVLPADAERRVEASDGPLDALVAGVAGARAHTQEREPTTPPWIA